MIRRLRLLLIIAAAAASLVGWNALPINHAEEVRPAQVAAASRAPVVRVLTVRAPQTTPPDDVLSSAAPGATDVSEVKPFPAFIYTPTDALKRQPLQVVIALHGMGGEGKSFGTMLVKEAEQRGWLLVAPTISYGDWRNPNVVAGEEIDASRRLLATIDQLPALTGLEIEPLVYVFGFSRGAQLAHRFAMFFPERVDGVAAFSAGTYTLPYRADDTNGDGRRATLAFPYGMGDINGRIGHALDPAGLRRVHFLVGVGGSDTVATDVPRQWDAYLGSTRVERARTFASALERSGVSCTLKVFPGAGHEITLAMLNQLILFFTPFATPSPLGTAHLD